MKTHETHPLILKRLKRAVGHLNGVIAMMEAERPCLELAQQLHAVESAVANAKQTLIHDHINHCLDESVRKPGAAARQVLEEFKTISKYL
jgi:DNA-binding FrmR family transcriptional regulator